MKKVNLLSKAEMKKVMGGLLNVGDGGGVGSGCYLRCDQDSTAGTTVDDCTKATATAGCGDDLTKVVCVCS